MIESVQPKEYRASPRVRAGISRGSGSTHMQRLQIDTTLTACEVIMGWYQRKDRMEISQDGLVCGVFVKHSMADGTKHLPYIADIIERDRCALIGEVHRIKIKDTGRRTSRYHNPTRKRQRRNESAVCRTQVVEGWAELSKANKPMQ